MSTNFRSAKGRRDFVRAFTAKHYKSRLFGGDILDCLDSVDIDSLFAKFTDIPVLPAEFSRIARDRPDLAKRMLDEIQTVPFIIPFNCEFHWIAMVVENDRILIANSARADSHLPHIEHFTEFLFWAIGRKFRVQHLVVPQQPSGTTECGVH